MHTLHAVEKEIQKRMKKSSKPQVSKSCDDDLRKLPLGFATGSDVLDSAGTIARVVHRNTLRELQNEVNNLLVQVQEFTANPKTDSSLGRVGR